jgi:hypothetical protein
LRLAESRAAEKDATAVQGEADERLVAALAEVPSRVLRRMLALADMGDDAAAAMLEGDAELVVWLARLMGDA